MRRGRPPYPDLLTPREWEVLALIKDGLTNRQIAQRLRISESGARFHVSEILSKLGVESRQEAVRIARGSLRKPAGLLGWMLIRLRITTSRRVIVGGATAVVLLTSILLLGALLTNRLAWPSSGPNQLDKGEALADFEAGNSRQQELGQSQFDPVNCVTGEEARNPRDRDGNVLPLTTNLHTIEDAERWLCLPLPRPRAAGLRPFTDGAPVWAARSHDLEMLGSPDAALFAVGGKENTSLLLPAKGNRYAKVEFISSTPEGARIQFEVSEDRGGGEPRPYGYATVPSGYSTVEVVKIQGTEGRLFRGLHMFVDAAMVVWEKDGYWFRAFTGRLGDFGLSEFLAILETVS